MKGIRKTADASRYKSTIILYFQAVRVIAKQELTKLSMILSSVIFPLYYTFTPNNRSVKQI